MNGAARRPPRMELSIRLRSVRRRARVGGVGRVLLHAADQVERELARLVVLRIRRHVGLRAGLLLAFGLDVPAQRGFAARIVPRLELLGNLLEDLDIRRDAAGLDRAAGRGEVARGGEPQRAVALPKRDDGLHRSLAERARSDDGRALVILQRAGDDFRRRGRAAVDQDDDRLALGDVAGPGVEALGLVGVAAAGRDDLALLEEGIRHRNGLVEQAARVVAQVDDEALQLVARLVHHLVDRAPHAFGGLFVELADADIGDVVAFHAVAHRTHPDDVARDRDLDRLFGALADDPQLELAARRTAHFLDRLVEGEALHRLVVAMGGDVVGYA